MQLGRTLLWWRWERARGHFVVPTRYDTVGTDAANLLRYCNKQILCSNVGQSDRCKHPFMQTLGLLCRRFVLRVSKFGVR